MKKSWKVMKLTCRICAVITLKRQKCPQSRHKQLFIKIYKKNILKSKNKNIWPVISHLYKSFTLFFYFDLLHSIIPGRARFFSWFTYFHTYAQQRPATAQQRKDTLLFPVELFHYFFSFQGKVFFLDLLIFTPMHSNGSATERYITLSRRALSLFFLIPGQGFFPCFTYFHTYAQQRLSNGKIHYSLVEMFRHFSHFRARCLYLFSYAHNVS